MANLVKRDNRFNELFDLRHSFDRLFDRVLNHSTSNQEPSVRLVFAVPPIEAWVDNDNKEYHLSIAVPGVDPKEIQLNVHGQNLTISGEHQSSHEKKDSDYLEQEFSYGRFARTIVLPEGVDTDKASAEYKNGVLEVTAPLSESALPKKIEIKSETKADTKPETKAETKSKGAGA
ncbi:MAG TPA: Hsp20/alpha crystallin family protein [Candidatus Acidoferrum sp.]|jgi:HSP20 family protein